MQTTGERLKQARIAAGYKTARDAANALGVVESTYFGHERDISGLSRSGARYAKFFKVSYEWLMNGRGPMKPTEITLEVHGFVGAGAAVYNVDGDHTNINIDYVSMPSLKELNALLVKGDSQYPRFMDGEYLLVEKISRPPAQLLGLYAVVLLDDGRRLVKIIRKSSLKGFFRIESHNAPPEDEVIIEKSWRVRGVFNF